MASDKEIDRCLAALETVYPNHFKSWTSLDQLRTARQIYHRVWRDIDGQLLEAATMQWLSTNRPFHPSPGELRDLALSLIEQGKGDKASDDAWAEVLNELQSGGSYVTPRWSSEAISKAMESFGRWRDFCMVETDQLPIVRAQFMRIYEAQRTRQHDTNLMLPEVQEAIKKLADAKRIPTLSGPR